MTDAPQLPPMTGAEREELQRMFGESARSRARAIIERLVAEGRLILLPDGRAIEAELYDPVKHGPKRRQA